MKKQFKLGYVLILITASVSLNAQDIDSTLKNNYEHKTIILDESNNKYVKDNKRNKIGMFGGKIEKEFGNTSPESKEEFRVYRKKKKQGMITFIAGNTVLVSLIVVAPMIAAPVFLGSFCLSTTAYTIGSVKLFKARRHLQKAVWLRNRDVLVVK